jgi:hypothetical protein
MSGLNLTVTVLQHPHARARNYLFETLLRDAITDAGRR